jgi:hypothetical protein
MRKKKLQLFCAVLAFFVVSCGIKNTKTNSLRPYAKNATWQDAMVASRAKLPELIDKQEEALEAVQLGAWYVAGPIKGGKFTDRSLAEKPVDLLAGDSAGKRIWRKNGFVEPVYLYRQIKAKTDLNLTASIDSRNTLEVWLNGRNVLTGIKEQGLGKGRHLIDLKLKTGTNELLIRVFNWRRRWEFYFSPAPNPTLKQWRQIKQDFPVESRWMEKDLGREACLALFGQRDSTELERKTIEKALAEIQPGGKSLRQDLQNLSSSDTPPGDKQWLDLYVKACRLREQIQRLDAEKARAKTLRAAAEHLVKSAPHHRQWSNRYLNRLKAFETKLETARASLDAGREHSKTILDLIRTDSIGLQRELVVKQPHKIAHKGAFVLDSGQFRRYLDAFNSADAETIVNFIPNAVAWDWMKANISLFECPDKKFEQVYYYRWWTFRKHIKHTAGGYVVTEFLAPVGHSGKYNTISCALGHHIYEGRWLHNQQYMDDYILFWYRGNEGKPMEHFHRYSNWTPYAIYKRHLVNKNSEFIGGLLDDFVRDVEAWEEEQGVPSGMLWSHDVWDGGEESISGSRTKKHIRPTINSYTYSSLWAIAQVAKIGGRADMAQKYSSRAAELKAMVQEQLWDDKAQFFKVRLESGPLSDAREAIGFIPWYFDLPDGGYEEAWLQILNKKGFKAPMGLTTAERRHPDFRSHGVGTCEWDGAIWPFSTSQTLVALANVLRNYKQNYVSKKDYFEALVTYAHSHDRDGKPYIGEYIDENTGDWLTPDSDRSRFYNHSTFCDLVITGLAGLVPRDDNVVEVNPLMPANTWDWFCLDNVHYHGRVLTILWDKNGTKYKRGKGLHVYADGKEIARLDTVGRVTGRLP